MSDQDVSAAPIADDVARLRRERAYARAFVDPFMGLLLARPPLVEELVSGLRKRPAPALDTAQLGQGACLEPRDEFPLDSADLRRVFEVLQPVLTHGFTEVRTDIMVIGQAAVGRDDFLAEVARDMLGDRQESFLRRARFLGVEPQVMGFWGVQLLTPLAMARGRLLSGIVADVAWNRGYCPVCGSWPGVLQRDGGEGGLMRCSFCATTWRFSRRECPYCEAPEPAGPVYAMPGSESERVTVCSRCNHYLAERDDSGLPGIAPEVADLALTPLELMARQHGHIAATMDWRQMVWR